MLSDRKVKIVATIGPSTSSDENLRKAIEAGMNVARLNFSHGDHEQHREVIHRIRKHSMMLKAPVAILQDLQGPKVRVGRFEGGQVQLIEKETVILSPDFKIGKPGQIPVDFYGLPESCKPGTKILLNDGLMELLVLEVKGSQVFAEVVEGGPLKDRKGVNIPGVGLPIDCLTPKDLEDLKFGLAEGVDYVALSFVRKGEDITQLREIINKVRPATSIVAKIEMLEALENLDRIIELSDGIMVARGDLAVEVGQTMLPGYQKKIIRSCNRVGCPVITATQMLDSMIENPKPTRAEITDIANAVLDGSDALMLSAETASGKHPFRCIKTMSDIICEVERSESYYYNSDMGDHFPDIAESIAASACLTARKLDAAAIICLTTSGRTATMISSYRPKAQIIAVTNVLNTLNRLQLVWGIQSLELTEYQDVDDALVRVEKLLLQYGLVKPDDKIILTLGLPVKDRAKTNTLRVYTIQKGNYRALEQDQMPLRARKT